MIKRRYRKLEKLSDCNTDGSRRSIIRAIDGVKFTLGEKIKQGSITEFRLCISKPSKTEEPLYCMVVTEEILTNKRIFEHEYYLCEIEKLKS